MDVTCGGWAKTRPATADTQKLCDQVKGQVEAKTNKTYKEFKATESRSQVVAGVMYLIKIHAGGCDYLHVYIFQSPLLAGKQETKVGRVEHHKETDPLTPTSPYGV